MSKETHQAMSLVNAVEAAVRTGNGPLIEQLVNRDRWGMEEIIASEPTSGEQNRPSTLPPMYNAKRPGGTVIVFDPPIDFSKGGSIPF